MKPPAGRPRLRYTPASTALRDGIALSPKSAGQRGSGRATQSRKAPQRARKPRWHLPEC